MDDGNCCFLIGLLYVSARCGSLYHVFQTGACFCLASGLQTAVRIDPELFLGDALQHLFDCRLNLLHRGNTGRVDVIDAGANFRAEMVFLQNIQNRQIGTACLKGDDIGIHVVDLTDDICKFTVAHMGVNLRFPA